MTKVSAKYTTYVTIFLNFQKKSTFFASHEIWMELKSSGPVYVCMRKAYFTSYHTFVINEYFVNNFDLTFAVYLAITFHYDVLKGLFDSRCCCWCEESAVIIERKPQFESGKDIYLSL